MPGTGAIDGSKTAAVSVADAGLVCSQDKSGAYSFCAPKKAGGDFYVAVHPKGKGDGFNDIPYIKALFGRASCKPLKASKSPASVFAPKNSRIYKVNSCLSMFVVDHAFKEAAVVGPNCYGTALAAAGYERAGERYVDKLEFEYYLRRDFSPTECASSHPYGNLVVYSKRSAPFEAGTHAAFELPGGLVFHKGDWMTNYPYETVAMGGAMQAILSHYVPRGNERFEPKPDPADYEGFASSCYAFKPGPGSRETSSTGRDMKWFLPLMNFYGRRLCEVSKLSWGNFREKRIDLLSIENMWRVLREFSGRLGNADVTKVLLGMTDGVAESYLELMSLDWQHRAMIFAYAPVSERHRKEEMEEIYRKNYVNFDSRFNEELSLYMQLLGVPKVSQKAVRAEFVARLKEYDPVKFASSNGGEGIKYMEELTNSIRSVVKNWKLPVY